MNVRCNIDIEFNEFQKKKNKNLSIFKNDEFDFIIRNKFLDINNKKKKRL